jgi:hypothetical protein
VLEQEFAPEAAAEQVGHEIAGDRRDPYDRDQHDHVDLALAGDEPAEQDRGLAGGDQADERARLEEGRDTDEQVGPRPERLAEVANGVLDVGQLEQPEAVGERGGRREQP